MNRQIFSLDGKELRDVERNLWVDVRRYERRPSGLIPTEQGFTAFLPPNTMEHCLDLVVKDLGGFRVTYEKAYEEVGRDQDIAYCVLPGPVSLEMCYKSGSVFKESHFRTFAIGKEKDKVIKIQDTLEKVIEKLGFRISGSHNCQLKDDIFGFLGRAYGYQSL